MSGEPDAQLDADAEAVGYEDVANLDGGFSAWKQARPADRRAAREPRGRQRCDLIGSVTW